jgi:predicted Zn finger-like uncharacterized protein
MLSRCPACATVFRVDTVQIRAREGRVRCGRCHAVFDALDAMVDIAAPRAAATVDSTADDDSIDDVVTDPAEAPEDSHATLSLLDAPDIDVRFEASAVTTDAPRPDQDGPPAPEPGGSMDVLVERTTDYWSARVAPADQAGELPADAPLSASGEQTVEPSPVEPEQPLDPDVTQPLDIASLEQPVKPTRPSPNEAVAGRDPLLDPPPALEPVRDPAMQRIRRELYGDQAVAPRSVLKTAVCAFGCAALVLTAAAQLVYHFRTDIAQAQPGLKPLLESSCARLGCTIPAPRQSDQVSIESSELTPEAGHDPLLRLSALLHNRAAFPQAWPHLELTLTDTADRAVVRRVLTPAEFLPPDARAGEFGAESEQAVSVLIDPADSGASGYRLYAFYP